MYDLKDQKNDQILKNIFKNLSEHEINFILKMSFIKKWRIQAASATV